MNTAPAPPESFGRPEEALVPPFLPRLIYYTLRVGVSVAAALIVVGVVLLASGPTDSFTAATGHGSAFTLTGLGSGLAHGQAVAVLLLGFLVLIVTPLVRVILSVALFAWARDRAFTLLTVTVLLLLGASVLMTAAG